MSVAQTGIAWTDATAGVLVGCSRKSTGCEHCYAEVLAGTRLRRLPLFADLTRPTNDGPRWTGLVKWNPNAARQVRGWRKGRRVFLNSMSDPFHESMSFEMIATVFAFMADCPQHTFQVLTKCLELAARWFRAFARKIDDRAGKNASAADRIAAAFELLAECARQTQPAHFAKVTGASLAAKQPRGWPLVNVELGASVENQETAYARIPALLRCEAWVYFLSLEPLLEEVDLDPALCDSCGGHEFHEAEDGTPWCVECDEIEMSYGHWLGLGERSVSWVIVGGESCRPASKARPFALAWARAVVKQCRDRGARVFVKQLGSQPRMVASDAGAMPWHRGAETSGPFAGLGWGTPRKPGGKDPAEWPADLRVQELPDRAFMETTR